MMIKNLLFSNPKAVSLQKYLAKRHAGDFTILTSDQAFLDFLQTDDLIQYDYCFILAELKWSQRAYIQHYGFDVAKKIRKNRFNGVIIFLSAFPQKIFSPLYARYALLRVPKYHHFYQLPDLPKDLPTPSRMSKELLDDIQSALLGIRPLVREIMHDLKNAVTIKESGSEETRLAQIQKAINLKFENLTGLLTGKKDRLKDIQTSLLDALNHAPKTKTNIQEIVEEHTLQILRLTPVEENEISEIPLPKTKWKVLFVDDDQNIREYLSEGLARNNIAYHSVSTSKEAMEALEEDSRRNVICVFICDLRLKDEKTEIWDDLQGYDLIREVYENKPNYLSFIALTSARSRLIRINKDYKINIQGFYKNDVLSSFGAMNVFAEKIREVGNNTFFQSRSQPSLTSWWQGGEKDRFSKPLALWYRDHILSLDYEFAEKKINAIASTFIENVKNGKDNEAIEFAITLKNEKEEGSLLQKFREHILLGRRISIGLFLSDFNEDGIFAAMQPRSSAKNKSAMQKFLFNTILAISFKKDFPNPQDITAGIFFKSNLLLEEIEWAVDSLNVDFDLNQLKLNQEDLDILSQVFENLQSKLEASANINEEDPLVKKFMKTDFIKILKSKNLRQKLKEAFSLAQQNKMKKSFLEDLALDLDEIKNNTIRIELESFLIQHK